MIVKCFREKVYPFIFSYSIGDGINILAVLERKVFKVAGMLTTWMQLHVPNTVKTAFSNQTFVWLNHLDNK